MSKPTTKRCTLPDGKGIATGKPCGKVMEPVELSKLGTVFLCPACDRQPGYKIDIVA